MDFAAATMERRDSGMLVRRRQCGSEGNTEEYSTGLHIFALFLIMTCGTLACSFPVLVKAFPKLAISQHALFISRHFGTGVLIALAFAHLLPTAFENLWNECLPYVWTEGYDAMPGVIAMAAALAVVLVEMGFSTFGVKHSHNPIIIVAEGDDVQPDRDAEPLPTDVNQLQDPTAEGSTRTDRSDVSFIFPRDNSKLPSQAGASGARTEHSESDLQCLLDHPKEQRMLLQCLLLEAGILFHSVFIGLSISVSTGTTFIALMVAISFHQMFEGLALGARIAAVPSLNISSFKPWAMSFAVSGANEARCMRNR